MTRFGSILLKVSIIRVTANRMDLARGRLRMRWPPLDTRWPPAWCPTSRELVSRFGQDRFGPIDHPEGKPSTGQVQRRLECARPRPRCSRVFLSQSGMEAPCRISRWSMV